jgi:hypothetical protein
LFRPPAFLLYPEGIPAAVRCPYDDALSGTGSLPLKIFRRLFGIKGVLNGVDYCIEEIEVTRWERERWKA